MVDDQKPQRITSRRMLTALTEAGILRQGDYVRRVIIDIEVDEAVVIHVQRYGDERLLRVAHDLAEHDSVTVVDPAANAA